MYQRQEKIETTTTNPKKKYSKTSKVSATSQESNLQKRKCSLQRLRKKAEKSSRLVKGLPMSLVNFTKNFTTTVSKTNLEMKAT